MIARWLSAALILSLLAPIEGWDEQSEHAIQDLRRPALERPMQSISSACNPTTLSAGLLAVALLGGPPGIETARIAVLALAPTNLVVEGLKRLTFRARPDGEHKRSNASFPSSHAANLFALAVVFSRHWRRAAPLFYLIATIVSASRLYLNRHFPTDVLFGAAIGALCAFGTLRLWERRRARREAGLAGRAMQ